MASVTLNATPHITLSAANGQALLTSSSLPPMVWHPSSDTLTAVVNLLKLSTTPNSSVHAHLYGQLQRLSAMPDFCNYLVHILLNYEATDVPSATVDAVRQTAGLVLKSSIRTIFCDLHTSVRHYVTSSLVRALAHPSLIVRNVISSCISEVVSFTNDLGACDSLLPVLLHNLDQDPSPTMLTLEASLSVLSRLSEDVPHLLQSHPSKPLDRLVPACIRLCIQHSNSVRALTLQILNHLALVMPPALAKNVDAFLNALFAISDDSSAQIRKRICTAICLLLEALPPALSPHMNKVIEFMLSSSTHPDQIVAREASEFWSLFAHAAVAPTILHSYLPRLVPVLIHNMTYTEEEVNAIDSEETASTMMIERSDELRPRFHQPRFKDTFSAIGPRFDDANGDTSRSSRRTPSLAMNGHASRDSTTNGRTDGSSEDDFDDSDDDGDDDLIYEDQESEWNVRKCSASALDVLSAVFKDDILEHILPVLQDKLVNSPRWEERECGLLVLGAVADGCLEGMSSHMVTIFPFLLHSAADEHHMVRSIACWTLSRYCKWVIRQQEDTLYQQLLKVMLDRMLDRSKVVQKASCSALAAFEEESGPLLSSYLKHILTTLTAAFDRYQRSNMYVLYDVVCTLADAVGSELATPDYVNVLMPLLISRWNSISDNDPQMLPLLECLASVFRALGSRSQQFAANIFSRCAAIINDIYTKEANAQRDDVHVEFLTCCLDLMCALAEALGSDVDACVAHTRSAPLSPSTTSNSSASTSVSPTSLSTKPVLQLLFLCMRDHRQEVRQSAFAFLGELARARLGSMVSALPDYFNAAIEALNPKYMSVSNNATWALGELVMMAGLLSPSIPLNRDVIQHSLMDVAVDSLVRAVNTPQSNKSLLENSALTLGRIGWLLPDLLSSRLSQFAGGVFSALRNIRDDVEKEQAFHGMNEMIKRNPAGIFTCFPYYVDAVASWYQCKPDLESEFSAILNGYKSALGDQWFALYNSLPRTSQDLLQERFRI